VEPPVAQRRVELRGHVQQQRQRKACACGQRSRVPSVGRRRDYLACCYLAGRQLLLRECGHVAPRREPKRSNLPDANADRPGLTR
jgi:hypothetical protein